MVVAIFPTKRDDRYNAVKKLCCVETPVPSQVDYYAVSVFSSPGYCPLCHDQYLITLNLS